VVREDVEDMLAGRRDPGGELDSVHAGPMVAGCSPRRRARLLLRGPLPGPR
jgi:hypothetical protein